MKNKNNLYTGIYNQEAFYVKQQRWRKKHGNVNGRNTEKLQNIKLFKT